MRVRSRAQTSFAIAVVAVSYGLQRRLEPFVSSEEQARLLARVRRRETLGPAGGPRKSVAPPPMLPGSSRGLLLLGRPSVVAHRRASLAEFAAATAGAAGAKIEQLTDFNVLESVLLMVVFFVLLGGAIFQSAVAPRGSLFELGLTVAVVGMIGTSMGLFGWMTVAEVRRAMAGAAARARAAAAGLGTSMVLDAMNEERRRAQWRAFALGGAAPPPPDLRAVEAGTWAENPLARRNRTARDARTPAAGASAVPQRVSVVTGGGRDSLASRALSTRALSRAGAWLAAALTDIDEVLPVGSSARARSTRALSRTDAAAPTGADDVAHVAPHDDDGAAASASEWQVCHDEDGTAFYFNDRTGDSQWEEPDELRHRA